MGDHLLPTSSAWMATQAPPPPGVQAHLVNCSSKLVNVLAYITIRFILNPFAKPLCGKGWNHLDLEALRAWVAEKTDSETHDRCFIRTW